MKPVRGWWVPSVDEPHPVESQLAEAQGQIDLALQHVKQRRVALQGGARVGLWPILLAARFERVIAFEPDAVNFACCEKNIGTRTPAVELHEAALGRGIGYGALVLSKESTGLHYVAPADPLGEAYSVAIVRVDALALPVLDAMFLDVEGMEMAVLEGALETLQRCHPTIVLEENALCTRYGRQRDDCRRFLELLGYRLVAEWTTLPPDVQKQGFRGSDLIFATP